MECPVDLACGPFCLLPPFLQWVLLLMFIGLLTESIKHHWRG
jgi:hypothetical protein